MIQNGLYGIIGEADARASNLSRHPAVHIPAGRAGFHVSLGVLKVAAALEARQLPVQVLDLSGIENYQDAVAAHAAASPEVCFGITATTPQMPAATEIAHAIKRVRPEARTIRRSACHARQRREQAGAHRGTEAAPRGRSAS